MEGVDSSCNDIIHCIIQGETKQEEETSIKQYTEDTSFQQRSKLPCFGLQYTSQRLLKMMLFQKELLKSPRLPSNTN